MKLLYSHTSPYARKVRILILEKRLQDRVDLISIDSLAQNWEDTVPNPLGKIPALVLDDKSILFDSPVICEYLDLFGDSSSMFTDDPVKRIKLLSAQALGDGILDAAFSIVMERNRLATQQSDYWLNRWETVINRALEAMALELKDTNDNLDIGKISFISALGYLDFRLPNIQFRTKQPILSKWWCELSERESVRLTSPD